MKKVLLLLLTSTISLFAISQNLQINPGNKDATQYLAVLEKKVASSRDTGSNNK